MTLQFETLKLVITWCDAFDNFLTDQYNHILIWDVDVQIWTLDNKILSMTSSNLYMSRDRHLGGARFTSSTKLSFSASAIIIENYNKYAKE